MLILLEIRNLGFAKDATQEKNMKQEKIDSQYKVSEIWCDQDIWKVKPVSVVFTECSDPLIQYPCPQDMELQ